MIEGLSPGRHRIQYLELLGSIPNIMGAYNRQEKSCFLVEARPGMATAERERQSIAEFQTPPCPRDAEGVAEAGDEDFYARHIVPMESRMARTVWRLVRDQDRTRDVLQNALATIWRRREIIRRHPNPEALILRICLNAACDFLRRLGLDRRLDEPDVRLRLTHNATVDVTDLSAAQEVEIQVQAAIARLPAQQAMAVLMRVLQEQSYHEIAQALGCSAVTARVHVMRGRTRLRRMLAHLWPATTR